MDDQARRDEELKRPHSAAVVGKLSDLSHTELGDTKVLAIGVDEELAEQEMKEEGWKTEGRPTKERIDEVEKVRE